jgi:proline iminopeptidase
MLYAAREPYQTQQVAVSARHTLYVEECGHPQGLPVLFLHGGPGAGCSERHRQLFDPDVFRVVLFDQRGSGKSTPYASLEDNTTWHLVADIEYLRQQLGIQRWLVVGGSWGSTLALVYAQTHPSRVAGLVLRGIFLCRPEEFRWFYQEGAHWLFPDRWEQYQALVPPDERADMLGAFYRRLTSPNPDVQRQAARAWSGWEGATLKLIPDAATVEKFESDAMALALARIECHYFVHQAFLTPETDILNRIDRIRHLPTWIIHGRYDVVCPVKNAWDLHRAFPEAVLDIIPDAGHAFDEPGILRATQEALHTYAHQVAAAAVD